MSNSVRKAWGLCPKCGGTKKIPGKKYRPGYGPRTAMVHCDKCYGRGSVSYGSDDDTGCAVVFFGASLGGLGVLGTLLGNLM